MERPDGRISPPFREVTNPAAGALIPNFSTMERRNNGRAWSARRSIRSLWPVSDRCSISTQPSGGGCGEPGARTTTTPNGGVVAGLGATKRLCIDVWPARKLVAPASITPPATSAKYRKRDCFGEVFGEVADGPVGVSEGRA